MLHVQLSKLNILQTHFTFLRPHWSLPVVSQCLFVCVCWCLPFIPFTLQSLNPQWYQTMIESLSDASCELHFSYNSHLPGEKTWSLFTIPGSSVNSWKTNKYSFHVNTNACLSSEPRLFPGSRWLPSCRAADTGDVTKPNESIICSNQTLIIALTYFRGYSQILSTIPDIWLYLVLS